MKAFTRSHGQTAAEGAFEPSLLGLLASSAASLWTSFFLQRYFPLDVRIWALAGSAPPVLPSPPHPQSERSGISQPSSGMSIYGSVVPKCGQIYKLPFPGDAKQFVQRAGGGAGRAGSCDRGLDFSLGPDPTSSGVGRAPAPPCASVSPPTEQRNWTRGTTFSSLDIPSLLLTNASSLTRGPVIVK